MENVLFVLCGNARTFIDCIDSVYTNLISKLFSQNINIYIYLYLKLSDPGPKGIDGWNFEYKDNDYNIILDKILKIKTDYPTLNIDYKLLASDEITDSELISQVKCRSLYTSYYNRDNILLRGLHCHYNMEKCGHYILEKEKYIGCEFKYIIYVRPDLFFINSCNSIETFNTQLVTVDQGPFGVNADHLAIVPREHVNAFFFDRMNVYRNNTLHNFTIPEEVYWHTINYEIKLIAPYYIKRS